jgi:LCP family protein required for cell wall assembly
MIVFYLALWSILTLDVLRLARLVKVAEGARVLVAAFTVAVLVATVGVGAYGIMIAGVTRGTIQDVFSDGEIAPPVDGRYNILLMGGDAGPDRDGLRPDSITVASVEAATGRVTTFGVPRNLEFVPFAQDSPMYQLYPNGYGTDGCDVDVCLINSIYTEVELYDQDLYPDAAAKGSSPGIEAMRDAVEGALGITIQYYVLIDMQGFSELIDALGGVTINSPGRYPINGDEEGNGIEGWIEPGVQVMNGYTALWYARSRYGTTDYDRMQRQRQVMEAVLQQFEPANVLTKFQAVATAGAQVVRTDIPQPMLGLFVELAGKAREFDIQKIELVPPLIAVDDGDFAYVHQIVAEALVIPTPAPE